MFLLQNENLHRHKFIVAVKLALSWPGAHAACRPFAIGLLCLHSSLPIFPKNTVTVLCFLDPLASVTKKFHSTDFLSSSLCHSLKPPCAFSHVTCFTFSLLSLSSPVVSAFSRFLDFPQLSRRSHAIAHHTHTNGTMSGLGRGFGRGVPMPVSTVPTVAVGLITLQEEPSSGLESSRGHGSFPMFSGRARIPTVSAFFPGHFSWPFFLRGFPKLLIFFLWFFFSQTTPGPITTGTSAILSEKKRERSKLGDFLAEFGGLFFSVQFCMRKVNSSFFHSRKCNCNEGLLNWWRHYIGWYIVP